MGNGQMNGPPKVNPMLTMDVLLKLNLLLPLAVTILRLVTDMKYMINEIRW